MENNYFGDKRLNIDITDYWLILRKRFFQVLVVFLLIFIGTISYTLNQPPVYQAESRIRISSRSPMATIEGSQITWYSGGSSGGIGSEIELISNKDILLNTAVDILRFRDKSKMLNSYPDRDYYTEEEVNYFKGLKFTKPEETALKSLTPDFLRTHLKIEPISGSDIIGIKIKSEYPNIVVAIVNVLAIVYKADSWKCKTLDAQETKNFVEKQLNKAKQELEADKTSLEESSKETVSLGSAGKLQDELTTLRIDLQKFKESYQDTHPKVIKLKNLIASIEDQLSKIPRTKQAYDDNLAEWELKQSLRKNLGEYFIKAEIDYEAKRLKSKDEVQIISKAQDANRMNSNNLINIVAGALFGIIVGCIYAFIWEGLDTSIGKIEDVERITRLPVIAHIPLIGSRRLLGRGSAYSFFRPLEIMYRLMRSVVPISEKEEPLDLEKKILFKFDSFSMTAEAYRTLRTNIQFAIGAGKTTGNLIEITSTSPREGKTLTSTNLAIALAQTGKMTLLLEADMRRPQIAKLFKINEKPGLSDILIGTVDYKDAIRTFTDVLIGNTQWENLIEAQGLDHLHIIPSGTLPPNPSELLLSNEFRELAAKLREEYDFVIIDTPPSLPVSDSSIVSTVVDGTVLIYQSDTTSRHLLLRAIQTLMQNQAKILGVVINQLAFDVVLKSGRANRYGYSSRYLYDDSEKAKGNL